MSSPPKAEPKPVYVAGPVLAVVVVIVAGAMLWFQFMYLPGTIEVVPPEILNPPRNLTVRMAPEAYLPTNKEFFVPDKIVMVLGVNNTVRWRNNDTVAHTATSDPGTVKPFDSGFVMPGESWTYSFTTPGDYAYHCTPHPWMKAKITVLPGPAREKTGGER